MKIEIKLSTDELAISEKYKFVIIEMRGEASLSEDILNLIRKFAEEQKLKVW